MSSFPTGSGPSRVRSGEWRAVAWSFLYFFCVLSAYYVMRPVREQLAAAVGSTQLPWFWTATLVATLVLTPAFAWLVSRWPRRVVVPVVYGFFIACLLGRPILYFLVEVTVLNIALVLLIGMNHQRAAQLKAWLASQGA